MCWAAILASGVSTLVLGARFCDVSSQSGDYAVEKLLEMTERGCHLRVITGVLTEECLDLRQTGSVVSPHWAFWHQLT